LLSPEEVVDPAALGLNQQVALHYVAFPNKKKLIIIIIINTGTQ
jgi:hypothetical protein